jgi:hypothetical protein
MKQLYLRFGCIFVLAVLCAASGAAGEVPVGYLSWDVNLPKQAGSFDIVNLTGSNDLPPDFPISSLVNLSSLNLTVDFVGGGSATYGPSYFTLAPDGQSFDGSAIPIGGTNPQPADATLTGTFSPTTISDPGPDSILPGFSVTVSDSPNLVDGDLGVIYATEATAGGSTPEPGTWLLLAMGLAGLATVQARRRRTPDRFLRIRNFGLSATLPSILCLASAPSAFGQVTLAANTSPSSGVSGVTNVNVTASGVPSGTIHAANVMASFSATCGGPAVTTEAANSVRVILGHTDRVNLDIPSGLVTGGYYVTLADSADGAAGFTSNPGSCSWVEVTGSSAVLNACLAGSSLGILLPAGGAPGNVTAYVPNGWWQSSNTGVVAQNIEGTIGTFTPIATPNAPNSCSSNPATGQTVCVANNTDVYLITGTALNTTLTSGSSTTAGFSGGNCNNCGVALNPNDNTAVINMGVVGSGDGGVQILNLDTNTFSTPFPMLQSVSENISVDPTRSLILSAGEGGNYTLLQIQPGGSLMEFDSSFNTGFENDSSAEDCSTGVAIAPGEFTNSVALVNLNSIAFGSGAYTAPNAIATLNTSVYGFSAGLSGSAVAQGSGHLAVVTGEFGGDTFAVLKLPASAGAGTPALSDYAIAQIPSSVACGGTFSAGYDPHTVTAYTSPNTGDSYAVFVGYNGSQLPTCLAVADLTTIINPSLAPRGGSGYGASEIAPADLPASAVTFFPLH